MCHDYFGMKSKESEKEGAYSGERKKARKGLSNFFKKFMQGSRLGLCRPRRYARKKGFSIRSRNCDTAIAAFCKRASL